MRYFVPQVYVQDSLQKTPNVKSLEGSDVTTVRCPVGQNNPTPNVLLGIRVRLHPKTSDFLRLRHRNPGSHTQSWAVAS